MRIDTDRLGDEIAELAAHLDAATHRLLVLIEETLLEMARASTASQLERICRGYRAALRNAAGERLEDEAGRRWVWERETEAGLVRFEVQLRCDEAAVVRRALEAAIERAWEATDVPAGTSPASLRRADALVAVAGQ
jgi:hypothetical protein